MRVWSFTTTQRHCIDQPIKAAFLNTLLPVCRLFEAIPGDCAPVLWATEDKFPFTKNNWQLMSRRKNTSSPRWGSAICPRWPKASAVQKYVNKTSHDCCWYVSCQHHSENSLQLIICCCCKFLKTFCCSLDGPSRERVAWARKKNAINQVVKRPRGYIKCDWDPVESPSDCLAPFPLLKNSSFCPTLILQCTCAWIRNPSG